MGFKNKQYLGFTTNKQSVRYVRGVCSNTGNLQCAVSSLYADSATQPSTITSVQLVANTKNVYEITGEPDYVYVFTLNSDFCGYYNGTATLTENGSESGTSFAYIGNSYNNSCSTTGENFVLALTSSNITASQGNYYTINSGTYTISLNSTQMTNTVTFSSVTFAESNTPIQTITVN